MFQIWAIFLATNVKADFKFNFTKIGSFYFFEEMQRFLFFFDENKTSAAQIEANLAAAGHDTKSFEASDKAYEALHPCCKYREAAVIEEHQ